MLQPKTLEQRVIDLEQKVMQGTEFTEENTEKGKAVNRGLKDKGITKGDENAIVRKALMYLIRKHGDENDEELADFISYFNAVEEVKADVEEQENHQ